MNVTIIDVIVYLGIRFMGLMLFALMSGNNLVFMQKAIALWVLADILLFLMRSLSADIRRERKG